MQTEAFIETTAQFPKTFPLLRDVYTKETSLWLCSDFIKS